MVYQIINTSPSPRRSTRCRWLAKQRLGTQISCKQRAMSFCACGKYPCFGSRIHIQSTSQSRHTWDWYPSPKAFQNCWWHQKSNKSPNKNNSWASDCTCRLSTIASCFSVAFAQEKLDKKHENKNITEKYIKKLKNRRLFEPSFRELYIKCRMSKLMISIKYTEINTNHLVICTAPHQEMPWISPKGQDTCQHSPMTAMNSVCIRRVRLHGGHQASSTVMVAFWIVDPARW